MKEPSYMIVIPMDEKVLENPGNFLDNLNDNELIKVKDMHFDEERGMLITFVIDGAEYQAAMNPVDVEIPSFVRPEHSFTDEEFQKLDEARTGLSICMDFDGDSNRCFYDQLRFINVLFPELLAILDCPSEKLLSGKWVALAAKSSVLPAPRYMFTVQAISDDGEEVWLHTHGLKRCGLYELEILGSSKEFFNDHYKMIESFALQMLESDDPVKPGDALLIGQAAGKALTMTAVNWQEALKYYPDVTIGTAEDREGDVHSEDTCVLMIYKNSRDEEEKRYTPVNDFNQFLNQNPMYMFSNAETKRMSDLAIERIPYMLKAFSDKENQIIVKIGLLTDKEYWNGDKPQREHIWFELKDVKDDCIVATLTQDPYYVSDIKTGDTRSFPVSDITDWLIFTPKCRITPDDAYLLES